MHNNYSKSIRKAELHEIPFLSNLAIQSKSYWDYDRDFINQCKPLLTIHPEEISKTHIYLMEVNSSIIGFYQLKKIDSETIDLDKLFVIPDAIGNGFGSHLMDHAKELAQKLGFTKITIESDPNATKFYEKFGSKFKGYTKSPIDPLRKLPNYILEL